MRELSAKGKPPPYFIAYEVHDRNEVTVSASYGALVQSSARRARTLDADVRVGDYKLDSTHAIRSNDFDFSSTIGGHPVPLPLSDDPTALRAVAWRETDRRYAEAAERLVKLRTQRTLKVAEEDPSDDFSREKPVTYLGPPAGAVRSTCRPGRSGSASCRGAFGVRPSIEDSGVTLQATGLTRLGRQLRGHGGADRAELRARVPRGERAGRRRDGARSLRELRRRDLRRARRHGRDGEGRRRDHRRPQGAAAGAPGRSLHRPGDPRGQGGGRVLPRDLRPPRRGAPAEERGGGADLRQEDRRADHARLHLRLRRSDAVPPRRHRSERLLPGRRRGGGGPARDAGRRTAC